MTLIVDSGGRAASGRRGLPAGLSAVDNDKNSIMGKLFGAKTEAKMADGEVHNEHRTERGREEAMNTELQTETNTARLMITKIVNENFKSYAGVQELGPFHKVRTTSHCPVKH